MSRRNRPPEPRTGTHQTVIVEVAMLAAVLVCLLIRALLR